MTAPDATAGDGLREAIARLLCVHYAGVIDEELPVADEILALPALRDVLAAAEERGYERGRRDFQFQPSGDNHHNAALCPYCSPADVLAVAARDAEKVRRVEASVVKLASEAQKAATSTDPELAHPYLNAVARIRRALDGTT